MSTQPSSRYSLAGAMLGLLGLVMLLLFTGAYFDSVYNSRKHAVQAARTDALVDAERIASLAQRELNIHPESIAIDISILATQPRVSVLAVLNSKGEILFSNKHAWVGRSAAGLIPGFSADRFAETTWGRMHDVQDTAEPPRVSAMVSFTEGGVDSKLRQLSKGVVYLEYDMQHDFALAHWRAQQRMIPLIIAAFGFLFFMAWAVRYFVTRPLGRIERASFELAENNAFPELLKEGGPREISQLAHWFNVMAQRILEVQADLHSSQARLSGIITAAMDAIITVDDNHCIRVINPAALKMFGCTEPDALGKPIDIFIPERFQAGHQGHMKKFASSGDSTRAHGGHSAVVTGRRLDGTEFPAEASISRLELAGESLMTVILRDITERQNAERALAELNNSLEKQVVQRTAHLQEAKEALEQQQQVLERAHLEQQAIFDTVTVGIVLLRDRSIVRCNRMLELIFACGPGELNGTDTRAWYVSEEAYQAGAQGYQELKQKRYHRREQEMVRKNGSPFWARLTFVPLEDSEHDGTYLGVIEDLTLQHQAEQAILDAKQQAEDASHAKSSFLANMSHEIRTPMNAIIGMSYLVLKTDLQPKQREQVEKIQASSQHLLALVNDILDYSKIEAGKLRLESVEFELDHVLAHVINLIGEKAASKGLELILDVDPEVPLQMVGDPLRLEQILTNYANNAVKFTHRGAITLQIRVQDRTADELLIHGAVIDTGIGLTDKQLRMLFQSFQQGDSSITREFGGTGLGLAICKQLAQLMGGQVGVHSEHGVGSTFWFTAWVGVSKHAEPSRSTRGKITAPKLAPVAAEPGSDIRGARILLVEDNELNLEVATELLTGEGLLVEPAANGQEAVTKVRAQPFDLVLMDMQMPVMDGLAATRAIRADARFANLPIVAMTANAMEADREACLNAGMDDHISKPIEPDMLFGTLRRWIKKDIMTSTDNLPTVPSSADKGDVEVPVIAGLDTETGLRRVMGKKSFYVSLLTKFVERQADVCDRLDAALLQGNWDDAQRTAHTLKGLAGSIGMGAVQDMALQVEQAIKEKKPTEVLQPLQAQLRQVVGSFVAQLSAQLHPRATAAESAPIDHARVGAVCKQLAQLLSEDDLEAGDLLTTNEAILRQAFGAAYDGIDAYVRRFDCEAALQSLREVATPLGYDL